MSGAVKKPSQEELLVDFAKQLRKHRDGRLAVHAHLSRLAPENRNSYIIREAAACFHPFIKRDAGQLFRLGNGDLVFISKGLSAIDVEAAVIAIRALVRHDPVLEGDDLSNPRHDTLMDWYELDTDYDAFINHVHNIRQSSRAKPTFSHEETPFVAVPGVTVKQANIEEPYKLKPSRNVNYQPIEAPAKPVAQPSTPQRPMTPADLDRLESNLRTIDPADFIEPRMVVAMVGENAPPHPVFSEHHISYQRLQNTVLPSCDIKGEPWLFARLAKLLEMQLLKTIKLGDAAGTLAFSFPSCVEAVLSDQFTRFDRERKRLTDRPIIVEIRLLDAMSSVRRYMDARERLRRLGYRICLHGLDAFDFTALNRDQILADFEKISWRVDYEYELLGDWEDRFKAAIAKAGRGRLILDGCDSRDAIAVGRSLGFTLFQGPYINDLLSDNPAQRQFG